ncbi:MAG TPA: LptE family protein [Bacteroidia bacterium]|jgi:hypothetical protein|nr:LptE family protein [Bacteroidia bacterium]
MKKVLALFFIAVFTSCGVGFSFSGASIPPDAKSISVQYFQNQAPLAGPTMSQTFTDALRDYATSQSHLKLVSNGDLDFAGSITGFTTQPVAVTSGSAGGQSSLTRLTVTIEVTFTDKNDAKKNFTGVFSRYADYPSSQSLAAVQGDLITQINKQLVQDVFDKAFNNW